MSWIGRTLARVFLAGAIGAATLIAPSAALAADEEYAKYYTVKASSENLTQLAEKFLGNSSRSSEVFNLNTGRKQPDGKFLTDPNKLTKGWHIVMPWDAEGTGIEYGVVPVKSSSPPKPAPTTPTTKPTTPTTKPTTPTSKPTTATPAPNIPVPSNAPAPGSRPSGVPSAPTNVGGSTCTVAAASSSSKSDWAKLRVAADKAWPQSKGKGQLVGIIDSGVNGSLPQLSGHVTAGADMTQSATRGDTDCLGTGTAMAALVSGVQKDGQGPVGVAPEATILPVRIVTNTPSTTPDIMVKGIQTAVASGATVIALGSYVDITDTNVAKAIATAVERNVLVVLGAPTESKPVNAQATLGDGVLRVAGVNVDHQWAADYRKGNVDVVAPGVNVTSLGTVAGKGASTSGGGTYYAVAYTAATAALVRTMYPDLDAKGVANRMKKTADAMADGTPPSNQYGYGFINPSEAVTKVLDEENAALPAKNNPEQANAAGGQSNVGNSSKSSGGRAVLLIVTALLMIAAALLLASRIRNLLRRDKEEQFQPVEREAPDLDPYDTRFRGPEPAMVGAGEYTDTGYGAPVSAPPMEVGPPGVNLGGGRPLNDGGEDHWGNVGGHWTDGADDGPLEPPRR
jgi:membrane-anchored mycosin MYCP